MVTLHFGDTAKCHTSGTMSCFPVVTFCHVALHSGHHLYTVYHPLTSTVCSLSCSNPDSEPTVGQQYKCWLDPIKSVIREGRCPFIVLPNDRIHKFNGEVYPQHIKVGPSKCEHTLISLCIQSFGTSDSFTLKKCNDSHVF